MPTLTIDGHAIADIDQQLADSLLALARQQPGRISALTVEEYSPPTTRKSIGLDPPVHEIVRTHTAGLVIFFRTTSNQFSVA